MAEVSLLIDKQVFKAKKEVLCEHSDYFRAMFSGNYVENDKKEISIDVLDAESMKIILQYMNIGLIDLTEYSLSTIGDLIIAVNFLQITQLMKQIEYTLDIQMSPSNCLEIMIIAQNSSFTKLEELAASCALLSFKRMKPEYIPNLIKLCWYLSHPYLDVTSEVDIFSFGREWLLQNETDGDALLIILGCLDIKRLSLRDLTAIKTWMSEFSNSLAAKVVDCLHQLATLEFDLSVPTLQLQEIMLIETYTNSVYNEVMNLMKESKSRLLEYTPVVPVWSLTHHSMFTFSEKLGFEHWLNIVEKNVWGWSIVAWGPTKLVVVAGECSRGTGVFVKDVKVYDTLRKKWTSHGVMLPGRRHAGVAIVDDSLYLIGGLAAFRIVSDSAIIYDLKQRSYRKIANLPDAIQSPAVCVYEGAVYAAGHKNIYKYEDLGHKDRWMKVIGTEIRLSFMISFKGYIYCTQSFFSHLYRFKPGVDKKLELISSFTSPPAAVCNLGNRLLFFTRHVCGQAESLTVEEYLGNGNTDDNTKGTPRTLWKSDSTINVNDVSGSCALVMSMAALSHDISNYNKKHLRPYETL